MRILFVTPYMPSRIRGRSFNLMKCLSASHEISLVSLICDEYERDLVEEVEEYCTSIDLVSLPKWQSYANCLLALPRPTPLRVAYYKSPAFVRRIREVIRRQRIDVVHGELIKVVPALREVVEQENVPVLYDSVDCISWYLHQLWTSARNPLQKAFHYTEFQKMRHYEHQSLKAFDQIVICADFDRDYLQMLGEGLRPAQIVHNGVDTEYFAPLDIPREKNSIVFCAKLDYYPNSQAILNFCREVLPLIWKHRPEVRLTIVGNKPPAAVSELSADKRITITGFVPDIRPYLSKASVAIAPLLVSAGTQFKVLEGLAMATPMVVTPNPSHALRLEDGVHLLVAEGGQCYADAVLKLLDDPALAQDLGRAGRQFIEQHYSWAAAAKRLNELYCFIAGRRGEKEQVLDAIPAL